tara:strand:- start:6664 stop:6810 length:147 start_codon:yes stop_codon:yes gene_type:complete
MSEVWNNNLFELIETNIDELPFKISNFSLFVALKLLTTILDSWIFMDD